MLGADSDLPPALRPEQWAGQPGTRAPHLWVSQGGERLSTLDLLQRDWVLLAEDERWCAAAARVGERLGSGPRCLRIGGDLIPPAAPVGDTKLTLDTPIARIVAEPAGKAALDAAIPGLTTHERYGTFKSMSLRQFQPVSQGLITGEALAKAEADLAAVQVDVTPPDPEEFRMEFRTAFGIGPSGASLIRPDGYVAWRSVEWPGDALRALTGAFARVSSARCAVRANG